MVILINSKMYLFGVLKHFSKIKEIFMEAPIILMKLPIFLFGTFENFNLVSN